MAKKTSISNASIEQAPSETRLALPIEASTEAQREPANEPIAVLVSQTDGEPAISREDPEDPEDLESPENLDDRLRRIKEKVKNLPQTPGVYIMKTQGGKIIYVGKAKSLRNRVRSYF